MKNICGEKFISTIKFSSEINNIIKKEDKKGIEQHATEEMLNLSDKGALNHLPPLPFTAALICLMLIVFFAINTAFILHPFHLDPSFFVSLYFSTALSFVIVMVFASAMIARGYVVGLKIYGLAFIFIILQFCAAIGLQFIDREDQLVKKMAVFFIMAIAIAFCRRLMNGSSFIRFIIYRITMRLSVAARKIMSR